MPMLLTGRDRAYRIANGALALSVAATVLLEIVLLALGRIDTLFRAPTTDSAFTTDLVRMFSFLTTQSNILAGVVAAVAVVAPHHDGAVWRVIRLDALIGISAIGAGFQLLFASSQQLTGLPLLLTVLYHYINPLFAVLIWLVLDIRRQWRFTDALWALIWPLTWMIFVFLHGAFTDWYPYGIIDVGLVGATAAYRTGAMTLAVLLALGLVIIAADRWTPSLRADLVKS